MDNEQSKDFWAGLAIIASGAIGGQLLWRVMFGDFEMSFWGFVDFLLEPITRSATQAVVRNPGTLALRAQLEAERRRRNLQTGGSCHGAREVAAVPGPIVPRNCESTGKPAALPPASSVSDAVLATLERERRGANEPKPPAPVVQALVNRPGPGPVSFSSSSDTKAKSAVVPPVRALAGQTNVQGGGFTSSLSLSRTPPRQSSPAASQLTRTHLAVAPLAGAATRNVLSKGDYRWSNCSTDADLIGRGIVYYYTRPYLAIDARRKGMTIARFNLALDSSDKFFQFFQVGLARALEVGGQRISRYDRIRGCTTNGRKGLSVDGKELEKVAPRIASFPNSLRLRENRHWSLPPGESNFAIRCSQGDVNCLPMVVKVRRRKSSEPLVKTQFFTWQEGAARPKLEFCGEGYMSWHSAIVLADCGRIGAKIAFPEGGWTLAELAADVEVSSDGKKFGRGLQLLFGSLPKRARQWASQFWTFSKIPLSEGR